MEIPQYYFHESLRKHMSVDIYFYLSCGPLAGSIFYNCLNKIKVAEHIIQTINVNRNLNIKKIEKVSLSLSLSLT